MDKNKIEVERDILCETRDYLIRKLKNYKKLQFRSQCTCCEQTTDREFFKNKIPDIESELKEIIEKLESLLPELHKNWIEKGIKQYMEGKERIKRLNDYITLNKNTLNKVIRDYNKGVEDYMPSIPDTEKSMWNEAMETHLANKNLDDNDELCFEIINNTIHP